MKQYDISYFSQDIVVFYVADISKNEYNALLDQINYEAPNHIVTTNRSRLSLKLELAAHALLYNLHIARERTRDCDLNYPQAWYIRAGYAVCGTIGLIFNK